MLAQLAAYIVLSIPLYHAFRTFKFINISAFKRSTIVLKNITSLKHLFWIIHMCPLIINKYIKRPNYLFNIPFIEFEENYDIVNLWKKWKTSHINSLCAL